jgi:acid phosphatase
VRTAKTILWLPLLLAACAAPPEPVSETQTFRAAQVAMPAMVADGNWSALPYQENGSQLPPAVILDIDQTTLTNPFFQAQLQLPFTEEKLNDWSVAHNGIPAPGVIAFAKQAEQHGVALFFITNRECEPDPANDDPCPQKAVVIEDLLEAGLPATPENAFLAGERPGWGKEKRARYERIAEDYRVIQLIGDDLSDFIPCVRPRPVDPCTEGGTIANRFEAVAEYDRYWGAGWYILPNPMHGSWTSVR